jgi:hypothetical protein
MKKFENSKYTNIVHHEKIHNIAFVTNINFFLYFELKQE